MSSLPDSSIENALRAGAKPAQPHPARGTGTSQPSARALRASAVFWLGTALLGQLLFAVYIAGFYGRSAVQGRPEAWNEVLPHGYVAGEPWLNAVLGLHLLFAATIVLGGAAQLLPPLRRRWPQVHRWNGRAYLLSAATLAVGGLILLWVRGTSGDLSQHLAISLNALLILVFAAVAWGHARARRFDTHRRWALRLFLAVSGVWFFRVGLMLWLVANQGPAGFDPETFTGPFLTFLAFAQYLLPLALLEIYFRAQTHGTPRVQYAVAGGIVLLTLAMAVGIAAAAGLMWMPRL